MAINLTGLAISGAPLAVCEAVTRIAFGVVAAPASTRSPCCGKLLRVV